MAILEVSGLSKRFGGLEALADVDLTVEAGEIVGIIGPNGAGKSSLLRTIAGLVQPSEGSIELKGRSLLPSHINSGLAGGSES